MRKRMIKIILLSLSAFLISGGLSFAVKQPKVDTLQSGYLIVGRYMIYMPKMTQKHFDGALKTVNEDYSIYYKSEFAGGTWYKVGECNDIFDITILTSDNIVDSKVLDSKKYWVQITDKSVVIKFSDDDSKTDDIQKEKDEAEAALDEAKENDDEPEMIEGLEAKLVKLEIALAIVEKSEGYPIDDMIEALKAKVAGNQAKIDQMIEDGGSEDVLDGLANDNVDLKGQLVAALSSVGSEDEAIAIIIEDLKKSLEEATLANDLDVALQAMAGIAELDPASVPADALEAQLNKLLEDQEKLAGQLEGAKAVATAKAAKTAKAAEAAEASAKASAAAEAAAEAEVAAAEAAAAAAAETAAEAASAAAEAVSGAESLIEALEEEQLVLALDAEGLKALLEATGNDEMADKAAEIAAIANDLSGDAALAKALSGASEAGKEFAKYDGIAKEDYSVMGLLGMIYNRYYLIRSYIEEDDESHEHSKEVLLEAIKVLDTRIYEIRGKGYINVTLLDKCVELEINREEGYRDRNAKNVFDQLLELEIAEKSVLLQRIPTMEGSDDERKRLEAIYRMIYEDQRKDYQEIGDLYEQFLQ